MQLSHLFSASLALLSSVTVVTAAPVENNIAKRQLGGGPEEVEPGQSWAARWRDTQLVEPSAFTATRGSGCSYDLTFRRDSRDTKYRLAYFSVFNVGEGERLEELTPVDLQWQGQSDSQGRRIYSAHVDNGCSTFYDSRPAPRAFKLYFTESAQSQTNYVKNEFPA